MKIKKDEEKWLVHFSQHVSNDFSRLVFGHVGQLRPRQTMVQVIFHLVVFWQAGIHSKETVKNYGQMKRETEKKVNTKANCNAACSLNLLSVCKKIHLKRILKSLKIRSINNTLAFRISIFGRKSIETNNGLFYLLNMYKCKLLNECS